MEGDRRVLQGESGTLGRRQWQAALEVLPRLLQGRLVSREQVVHRAYHDQMGLHADTGEACAVGRLVAGDRELGAPALWPRECPKASPAPPRRPAPYGPPGPGPGRG